MSQHATPGKDIYLENFRTLANVLFALCMFSSVLKIEFPAENLTDSQLLPFLLQSFDAFINFTLAFIFLAMYWIKFIGRLECLTRSNNPLLILWMIYLAVLCTYPFAESLIGSYPESVIAQVGFSAIWATIGILGFASWCYAYYAKLIDPAMSETAARAKLWESVPEPAAALVSIPFAFYSEAAYYLSLLLLIPANYWVNKRFPPDR